MCRSSTITVGVPTVMFDSSSLSGSCITSATAVSLLSSPEVPEASDHREDGPEDARDPRPALREPLIDQQVAHELDVRGRGVELQCPAESARQSLGLLGD